MEARPRSSSSAGVCSNAGLRSCQLVAYPKETPNLGLSVCAFMAKSARVKLSQTGSLAALRTESEKAGSLG